MIADLNQRAQEILRFVVDTYMETGEPVGSRTLARQPALNLSPATIRNVMADLEAAGLLYAPHVSAGRMPTSQGLRLYIDGLMERGNIAPEDREAIDSRCRAAGRALPQVMEQAGTLLSGLSAAAGVVIAPKTDKPLKYIQFVRLDASRALVILVMQDGSIENRAMDIAPDVSDFSLTAAANYLNSRLAGKTLAAAQKQILTEIAENRAQLDRITADLVAKGLALPATGDDLEGSIIIRGQSRLLEDIRALDELEKTRQLLAALEEQETLSRLLDAAQQAEGVQIYLGAESPMFEHAGWALVLSPYKNPESRIVGAIGVIGPTRLNYRRIIPLVDYTSQVMSRLLER